MEYSRPRTFGAFGERPPRRILVDFGPETAGFVLGTFLPVIDSFIIICFLKQSLLDPKMNECKLLLQP